MGIVFTISIYCMGVFRGGFSVQSPQMNSFLLQKPKHSKNMPKINGKLYRNPHLSDFFSNYVPVHY